MYIYIYTYTMIYTYIVLPACRAHDACNAPRRLRQLTRSRCIALSILMILV